LYNTDESTRNINNGLVIGIGAVFGTLGIMIQYFYRAAPYVDASMQATAALIISAVKEEEIQESAEKLANEMVAEAEEEAEEEEAEDDDTLDEAEESADEADDAAESSTEEDEQRKKF
jgi:predicted metal-binding transcription factor (methanogenesis marker protein 9)